MRVVKRNGLIEKFDIMKALTSIINSAFDINFIVTQADSKIIATEIEKRLMNIHKNDDLTNTYEIRGVVIYSLIDTGFNKVAEAYIDTILSHK